jgi:hypothetical protein
MRAKETVVVSAVAGAALLMASPASAEFSPVPNRYTFTGGKGTICVVDVGARASRLGGLHAVPQVGFSAVPQCTYPAATTTARPPAKRRRRCARKQRGEAAAAGKRRRCRRPGRRRARAGAAIAGASVAAPSLPATIPLADLSLVGPGGAVANVAPYSCTVKAGANCASTGHLEPAAILTQYFASYALRLAPPPGESWTTVPAGCSGGAVPSCTLTSEPVAVNPL